MGLPEPVGVGSFSLTALMCCSAVSSLSWFLGELRQKIPTKNWNTVRIYCGKGLAGCREGGFVSKALCVLVLLIRNESKGLSRVRATDKFPVWGVGRSQRNSHSCPWCLHSRAQHFPSSRSSLVSELSLSLSSCYRHTRVSIRIVSANSSFSAVQILSQRRQQCWFLISVFMYLSKVFAQISCDKMWEWDNRFLTMSQTSGNEDWNVFLNSYFKTGHPVSWHSYLEFFSISNTIF